MHRIPTFGAYLDQTTEHACNKSRRKSHLGLNQTSIIQVALHFGCLVPVQLFFISSGPASVQSKATNRVFMTTGIRGYPPCGLILYPEGWSSLLSFLSYGWRISAIREIGFHFYTKNVCQKVDYIQGKIKNEEKIEMFLYFMNTFPSE